VLTLALGAAERELAGNWIGAIDTTRGQMEIGLNLHVEKDKLVGVIKTAHGDWGVTRVVQKDGEWTVSFKRDGNEGQMIGRITDNTFAGQWKSMMADGTFELTRAKAKGAVTAPR
jgi:hypothetical protein